MNKKEKSKAALIPARELIPLESARSSLTKLWLLSALLLFALLIVQSILGHYADQTGKAWTWLVWAIVPTVTLVLGVLAFTALETKRSQFVVRKFFFRIAFWLSSLYLVLVLLTIVLEPFLPADPIELMQMSRNWLYPMQSLVAAVIGAVFFKANPNELKT
jgi:cytochrome bd-type quinol oxidase subunit 2